jgi:non-ribosomal peptide synthetase component F
LGYLGAKINYSLAAVLIGVAFLLIMPGLMSDAIGAAALADLCIWHCVTWLSAMAAQRCNPPDVVFDMIKNVRELIEARSREYAAKVYLLFQDQKLTFNQIDRRVNQVANGLSSLGVAKGDRVALFIKNSPEFIYAWWAILKLGAVMVPVNLRLTARRWPISSTTARPGRAGGRGFPIPCGRACGRSAKRCGIGWALGRRLTAACVPWRFLDLTWSSWTG